jgi:hypothetical protein
MGLIGSKPAYAAGGGVFGSLGADQETAASGDEIDHASSVAF